MVFVVVLTVFFVVIHMLDVFPWVSIVRLHANWVMVLKAFTFLTSCIKNYIH